MKGSFDNAFDKKTPENKKYAHIQSSIDTGASARKQQVVSSAAAAKHRDEIFKRIRPATLVRLLQEREVNESVYAMGPGSDAGEGRSASSVTAEKAGPPPTAVSAASKSSVAGSVLSVVESDATVDEARDLVLLDLRDPEQYERCRLPLALNYPAAKINRDQFPPELFRCKRDASKLLVIYHDSDQTSAGAGTLLVQKGWEKVYILSGGFDEMVQSYPEVLEGEVPDRPATGATARSVRTSASVRTSSSRRSVSASRPGRPPSLGAGSRR